MFAKCVKGEDLRAPYYWLHFSGLGPPLPELDRVLEKYALWDAGEKGDKAGAYMICAEHLLEILELMETWRKAPPTILPLTPADALEGQPKT